MPWGMYWKAVLEVSQGYLGLFLKLMKKMHGKDWEGKQRFQGLCGHLSKKHRFGFLIKVCKTEVRCPNATRMGEVVSLPEHPPRPPTAFLLGPAREDIALPSKADWESKALATAFAPCCFLTSQRSQWLWFGHLAKATLNFHRIFICRLRFGLGYFFFSVQFDACIVVILQETLSPHHKQALGNGSFGCQRYFHSFLAFVLAFQPRLCSLPSCAHSPIGEGDIKPHGTGGSQGSEESY